FVKGVAASRLLLWGKRLDSAFVQGQRRHRHPVYDRKDLKRHAKLPAWIPVNRGGQTGFESRRPDQTQSLRNPIHHPDCETCACLRRLPGRAFAPDPYFCGVTTTMSVRPPKLEWARYTTPLSVTAGLRAPACVG